MRTFRGAIWLKNFPPFHPGLKCFFRLCSHSCSQQLFTERPLCAGPWAQDLATTKKDRTFSFGAYGVTEGSPVLKVHTHIQACIHLLIL